MGNAFQTYKVDTVYHVKIYIQSMFSYILKVLQLLWNQEIPQQASAQLLHTYNHKSSYFIWTTKSSTHSVHLVLLIKLNNFFTVGQKTTLHKVDLWIIAIIVYGGMLLGVIFIVAVFVIRMKYNNKEGTEVRNTWYLGWHNFNSTVA